MTTFVPPAPSGLPMGIQASLAGGQDGSNLRRAYIDPEHNGIRLWRGGIWGDEPDRAGNNASRSILFRHPRSDSKYPDHDAGQIFILPSGTFYRDPKTALHSMESGNSAMSIMIPTDPTARGADTTHPDRYVATFKDGQFQVSFVNGKTHQVEACVVVADTTSDRYLGPSGFAGIGADLQKDEDRGGALFRSRPTDFIPQNEAFSTMHVTAPLNRIGRHGPEQSGQSHEEWNQGRHVHPRAYFHAVVEDRLKGSHMQDPNWCCGYGLPEVEKPFPRYPLQGDEPREVFRKSIHRARVGGGRLGEECAII